MKIEVTESVEKLNHNWV